MKGLAKRIADAIAGHPSAVKLSREVRRLLDANPALNPPLGKWKNNSSLTQTLRYCDGMCVADIKMVMDKAGEGEFRGRVTWTIYDPDTKGVFEQGETEFTNALDANYEMGLAKDRADGILSDAGWKFEW